MTDREQQQVGSLHSLLLPDGYPLDAILAELLTVDGLVAVVLGGSWAAGRQRPDSDVDLGLFYRAGQPLDIDGVRRVAEKVNDTPGPVVTPIGGWGQWVNGGSWLTIGGRRTDFLYRDLDFVNETIDACLSASRVRPDYWQQPPYGFHPEIYCAEVKVCRPLYDPESAIAPLKERVALYPEIVKQRRVSGWLWGARFTLTTVKHAPQEGLTYLVAGHLTRAATEMIHALYALNETWFMNDKYVYREIAEFAIAPPDFMARIDAICGGLRTPADMQRQVAAALALHTELMALAGDLYTERSWP
jgi:hypothetical protein